MTKCSKCGEAFDAPCDRDVCPKCWRKALPPCDVVPAQVLERPPVIDEYAGFEAGRPEPKQEMTLQERVNLEDPLDGPFELKRAPGTCCPDNPNCEHERARLKALEEAKPKRKKKFVVEDKAQKALEGFT